MSHKNPFNHLKFFINISFGFLWLILLILFAGCRSNDHGPVSKTQILMGTYISITDYDYTLDKSLINKAIDSAFQVITTIEKKTNPYDSGSVVGKLNLQNRQPRTHSLDTLLSAIVKNSLKIAKESEGKFDFTLWPVFRLWHFGTDSAAIPDSGKIDSALQHVDYQNVKIDTLSGERENLTQLHVPSGVELDFGGISKGFALEMARKELTKHGLRNFIIDAGGNLAIEWSKPDSVQIYVRHPRMEGEFWGQFPVYQSCGIATSGDYHFYFLEDGKRYHHILDPQTGYPVEKTASCSIVAPTSTLADGYSTAVFVMGMERGSQFIESRSELEGLMIYPGNDSLQTYLSSGLQNRFKRMEVGE